VALDWATDRVEKGVYDVTNVRGGRIRIGGGGDSADFTPVELLLTAIAGCSATDVDFITAKRAEPDGFTVTASGEKLRDEDGNHMGDLTVTFTVAFPEGNDGDRAREMLPKAIAMSHDRLCTVTRTVVLGTPVLSRLTSAATGDVEADPLPGRP
jgi:putative redox protein